MILAALAGRLHRTPDPDQNIPYPLGRDLPLSAPVPIETDVPEGPHSGAPAGTIMHPSVVDLAWHGRTFAGYRYLMSGTPHHGGADDPDENPYLLGSNDGFRWETFMAEAPIADWPGLAANDWNWYNSDSCLCYDPATGKVHVYWRESKYSGTGHEAFWERHTRDGVEWSDPVQLFYWPVKGGNAISSSIMRVGQTWRLYLGKRIYTAPTPEGPFTDWTSWTMKWETTGAATSDWHRSIIYHQGVYYGLHYPTQGANTLYCSASRDGLKFTVREEPLVDTTGATDQWDGHDLYQSTMQPTLDGDFRVWYGGVGNGAHWDRWSTGFVRAPNYAWPGV